MRNSAACVRDPHTFISDPGKDEKILYTSRFNGKTVELVESGRMSIKDSINAWAQYTDISYMLNRLKIGDTSVLSSKTPLYGDFSGLPTNPADAINIVRNAESAFGQLSADDRKKYNNDYRVWLASCMSGSIPADSTAGRVENGTETPDSTASRVENDKKE